ncbi:transglycosylase SLT domain-containing protein [Streptomyces sp. H27-D2]|uniref:transglycosylase SLT domain-containing protein n=1 Tax=Streptomyces sp. H27-D2 TaxID=3046304 RepID=UPI002DBDF22C|nr:transglycosylase SLT domain-containing protein [Streptomyces sp. H27-D2]MEC4020900.1 transglycosylase SLT domain-containing protein [Streptomyces sp. H27-D2]
MPIPTFSGHNRLNKTHKISMAGIAALGAAALAFSVVPGNSDSESGTQSISAKPVAFTSAGAGQAQHDSIVKQSDVAGKQAKVDADAKKKADAEKAKHEAEAKKKADAARADKARADQQAKAKAKADRDRKAAASRSAERAPVATSYANNLDGWIKESLSIMKAKGIPGSYDGIHRNIMRESGGNPNAVNNTDSNAVAGTPSKGLLQTIQPTFDAFHVEGTANSMTDPVANITAACNYAAKTYGSIDNVDSAY